MTGTESRIAAFLQAEAPGWAGAQRAPLHPDASARRYHRLTRPDGASVILMDAATEPPETLARFLTVARFLSEAGLSAPSVLAADPARGLALIEDFGTLSLADLHRTDPARARVAFGEVGALLDRLARQPLPDWAARPDAAMHADMATLTFERLQLPAARAAAARAALADALARHAPGAPVLAMRDVHADNLMWLADRQGVARVGLLDFQDALALPAGYDLASLVDDPRRVISPDWRAALVAAAADRAGVPHAAMTTRINTLSVLRNLRILGILPPACHRCGQTRLCPVPAPGRGPVAAGGDRSRPGRA